MVRDRDRPARTRGAYLRRAQHGRQIGPHRLAQRELAVDVARAEVQERVDGTAEDHRQRAEHPRPPQAVARGQTLEARRRERREQHQGDGGDREVAADHREAAQRDGEEQRDAPDEQRRRHEDLLARHPPRERDPGEAEHEHRRLREVREVAQRHPRQLVDRLAAPELRRRLGRVVQRVHRVTGDDQVADRPDHRRDGDDRARPDPHGERPAPDDPQRVQPRQHPRLRAHEPGQRQQHPHHTAAARSRHLERRRPDHESHVGDVDVPARGQKREVQPAGEQQRRDDADDGPEDLLAERVHPRHQPDEGQHADREQHAVAAFADRRQRDAQGDPQRVLRRRAVRVEGRQPAVEDLPSPQQRVERVVVRIRREGEEARQRGGRQQREGDRLVAARRHPGAPQDAAHVTDHTTTGSSLPRTCISSTCTMSSRGRVSICRTESARKIVWPVPFVIVSRRDAVFVVSPIVVYSIRRSLPTLPAMTGPAFRPIPILKSSPPRSRIQALTSASAGPAISSAAASARSAWSTCSVGAPKAAMMPSPM